MFNKILVKSVWQQSGVGICFLVPAKNLKPETRNNKPKSEVRRGQRPNRRQIDKPLQRFIWT